MTGIIKVGIGCLVIKEGKVLYGLRKSQHGEGTYSPPGGHLEYGETIEACSVRELYEESGLIVNQKDVNIHYTLNEIYPNNEKHYINIITLITHFEGEVENKEPDKLERWEWLTWDEVKQLGKKNFLPMQNLIAAHPNFDPTK